jgi:FecR-like protein
MTGRWRAVGLAGLAVSACLLFALGSASGAVQPPNLTGTWTPTGGGAFALTASGPGLDQLHADWQGTGAHSQLHGSFDGTLNTAGDAYSGSLFITEGSTSTGGSMTFHIDSLTQLTVTYSQDNGIGGTIVMTGQATPPPPPPPPTSTATPPPASGATTARDRASVKEISGDVTVIHADGSRELVSASTVLKRGDQISTDVDAHVVLHFADGTNMNIQEMTELYVDDLLSQGSRQAITVQLKMGEIAAKINPNKDFRTNFKAGLPYTVIGTDLTGKEITVGHDSVRGSEIRMFSDPGTRSAIVATLVDVSTFTPSRKGAKPITIPAGKEIEVTPRGISPLAPIGKANAHGGIDREKAFDLVMSLVGRSATACGLQTPTGPEASRLAIKPASAGWVVSLKVAGKVSAVSTWSATAGKATPLNALAKQISAECSGTSTGATGVQPSVTFTATGSPVGQPVAAPSGANDIEANMDPHTGVIANAYWTQGGHSLGPIVVPARATGLVFATAAGASPGTPLTRPKAATDFHVLWNQNGVITSAYWTSVGRLLATIPVASGQKAIAFTNGS